MTDTMSMTAIHQHLDKEPWDWLARQALADLYEGAGEDDLAYCQRWLVSVLGYPTRRGAVWVWSMPIRHYLVPERVWYGPMRQVTYPTRRDAENAVAKVLASLPR